LNPENVMVCFKETLWENWSLARPLRALRDHLVQRGQGEVEQRHERELGLEKVLGGVRRQVERGELLVDGQLGAQLQLAVAAQLAADVEEVAVDLLQRVLEPAQQGGQLCPDPTRTTARRTARRARSSPSWRAPHRLDLREAALDARALRSARASSAGAPRARESSLLTGHPGSVRDPSCRSLGMTAPSQCVEGLGGVWAASRGHTKPSSTTGRSLRMGGQVCSTGSGSGGRSRARGAKLLRSGRPNGYATVHEAPRLALRRRAVRLLAPPRGDGLPRAVRVVHRTPPSPTCRSPGPR